ncbi:hypothetical protein Tco_1505966 [Tanacetum coccineum]
MLQQLAQYGIEHIETVRVPEDIPFERRRHGTKYSRRHGTRQLRQHKQPKRKHRLPKWKTLSDGLQGMDIDVLSFLFSCRQKLNPIKGEDPDH